VRRKIEQSEKGAGGEKQLTPLLTISQQSRESNKDTVVVIILRKQIHAQRKSFLHSVDPSSRQSSELYCDKPEAMRNAEPH
jgi:hypothetical protein